MCRSTMPNGPPRASVAEHNWWRCCSASRLAPILWERSAMGSPVVCENWYVSELVWRRRNPLWPMPTGIGLQSCTKNCFTWRWRASANRMGWGCARRSSVSKINCCRSTPQPSTCLHTVIWLHGSITPSVRRHYCSNLSNLLWVWLDLGQAPNEN